jgi:hypothetical protein
VLGWEQQVFCCKTMLDGMGQDGRYIRGKNKLLNIAYMFVFRRYRCSVSYLKVFDLLIREGSTAKQQLKLEPHIY